MIKFTNGNRKFKELASYLHLEKNQVWGFDLPAGHTCPMASLCLSKAHQDSGKITDGADMVFRCYAASTEAVFTATRKLRWNNFNSLRGLTADAMADLIDDAIPATAKIIRIHASGDFFSRVYFMAWVKVAQRNPDIQFFGYTKVMPYVTYLKPDNFKLVYSHGGKMDADIVNGIPVAYVVKSAVDASLRRLPVACKINPADDYDYVMRQLSFALVLHGTQPAHA